MPIPFDATQFLRTTGEAVVAANAKGAIVFWNAGAQRIFGYTSEEAIGRSLDIIIPERLRERHWAGYDHTMSTGQTRYGNDVLRVPAIGKDARALSIAFTVTLMRDPADGGWIIVATMRDETARFQEERALKRRIAELEVKSKQ